MDELENKLEQLEKVFKRIDKLFYRLIQIAGTIGILIMAIKSWFTWCQGSEKAPLTLSIT